MNQGPVGGSRGCSGRDRAFADRRGQMTLPDSGLKSKGWARVKPVLRVWGVLGGLCRAIPVYGDIKVGPDGLEPSTHGLKVRCSTD